MPSAPTPRFLCDAMLGRLARDLRLLGYEVAWTADDPGDEALRRRAREEGRVLVSRDKGLVAATRADGTTAVLLESNDPLQQLEHLVDALRLRPRPEAFLTRCSACDEALREGPGRVPPPEAATPPFRHCPRCGRTYWEGTHVDTMRERFGQRWGGA